MLTEPAAVAQQALRLAPDVDSICLHGDTDGAIALARAVRAALSDAGVQIRPFANSTQ